VSVRFDALHLVSKHIKMTALNTLRVMTQYGILAIVCLGCDKVLSTVSSMKQLAAYSTVMKCVIDSSAHGLIALYSWLLIVDMEVTPWIAVNSIFCFFISCCVDVDHFIAAGSWKLKDALRLKSRPPFHSTSILLPHVILVISELISKQSTGERKRKMEWIILSFTAVMTHHLRDAYRRGLWFWPFGSTPPLTTPVYIISTLSVPFVVSHIRRHFDTIRKSATLDIV